MPTFDVIPLLEEDEVVKGLDYPFRFGKSFDVNLTLKDGKWTKTDSAEIWSLKITSKGAYSLNFVFSEVNLPEEAELFIYNEEGSMVYGPVTEQQNQFGNIYLTDIIQGETAIIQLIIPLHIKEKASLKIQKIIHGYKNIFKSIKAGYGDAGDCFDDYNSDVVCYSTWNNESDGVVQILLSNGTELCSGSLLNNTAQDFKPYILTAFHCIDIGDLSIQNDPNRGDGELDEDEIDQAEEWLVRFRFRHTTCGGNTIANVITYDDTDFRAAWNTTDFALVELQDNIVNDINSVGQKVWLGWDRTGNTPSSGTCIYHPSGDVAKISFENNNLTETSYLQSSGTSHWRVSNWDTGVTEGGSSGSPLFDQNKRVVGQLHGGYSSCDDPDDPDWYGCFDQSWTGGGTNATRLSNWLQPTGSSTTLNSIRQPTPQYSGGANPLCSTTYFSVTNLAPGYTIHHWAGDNVSFPNGNTGNPVQVAPGSAGNGYVQAVISTGGGNYTMARSEFWVDEPDLDGSNFIFSNEFGDTGYFCTDYYDNEFDLTYYNDVCDNYEVKLSNLT